MTVNDEMVSLLLEASNAVKLAHGIASQKDPHSDLTAELRHCGEQVARCLGMTIRSLRQRVESRING